MNEATGTDFIVTIYGQNIILRIRNLPARMAIKLPTTSPNTKPDTILTKEKIMVLKKSVSVNRLKNLLTTDIGVTKNRLSPKSIATNCQTKRARITDASFSILRLLVLVFLSLS